MRSRASHGRAIVFSVRAGLVLAFSMPAMPSMNMPTIYGTSALTHDGSELYRGSGQLSMAETWNVLVTASCGAKEVGRSNFGVIAK